MSTQIPEEIFKILEKAEDALQTAEHDLKGGFLLATSNRAYYSSFYCMTALLYTKQVTPKTHLGTHTRFAELFIKTNIFPAHAINIVADLFGHRQDADYDVNVDISETDAQALIAKATEFFQLTKNYFNKLNAQ